MARIKLKVCGMKDPDNIREIAEVGPDYMGFIFYPESPRFVGPGFKLPHTRKRADPVGVFVNEPAENITHILRLVGSKTVQLHGDETPDDCKRLRAIGVRVIKAVPMGEDFNANHLHNYVNAVDYFLFDTKGKLFGGNAAKFDWKLLERYDRDVPFFLSGGIGPDDIAAIGDINHPRLYGIDLNSGVEVSPGLKDVARVKLAKELLDKL